MGKTRPAFKVLIEMTQVGLGLLAWLNKHYHGEMDYMAKHGTRRTTTDDRDQSEQHAASVGGSRQENEADAAGSYL
ncbi:MAG: hypothetical protein ACREUR_02870 [Nitrosospira sp.]